MTNAAERYERVSADFQARLDGVRDDQWGATVPSCPEWTVQDLVAHVIGTHRGILGALGQEHPEPRSAAELKPAWQAVRDAALQAVNDPATAERLVESPFGEMPFRDLAGGPLCGDTIYHTWDLAGATGQDTRLDEEACVDVLEAMEPMDDAMRAPGLFSAKIDPPAGADPQSRLLAFGGRRA